MERTYFEFKITFLHIVVFLVAVVAIGILLFYMGYQAGQRRFDPRTVIANESPQEEAAGAEELNMVEEPPLRTDAGKAAVPRSIPEEMKLHEQQAALKAADAAAGPPPAAARKEAAAGPTYTIQVGAFADFANAQRCSRKFTSLGYPAAIITDNQRKLHTVQVGSFASLSAAQAEKAKLEKQENAKFQIKQAR